MKLLKLGVFLSMLLMTPVLEAQNTSVSLWEENIEQLSMDEEEKNWEDELEELSNRLQEPVNINVTTKRELEQFPFLSDIQIENILAYVYIHGQMQTIYELQLVEEVDKHTIDLLLPFVCVHPVPEKIGFPRLKSLLKYGKQEVLTRLDVPFYTRKDMGIATETISKWELRLKRMQENLSLPCIMKKDMIIILSTFCFVIWVS